MEDGAMEFDMENGAVEHMFLQLKLFEMEDIGALEHMFPQEFAVTEEDSEKTLDTIRAKS